MIDVGVCVEDDDRWVMLLYIVSVWYVFELFFELFLVTVLVQKRGVKLLPARIRSSCKNRREGNHPPQPETFEIQ